MITTQACPRCAGSLISVKHEDEPSCLHCGYVVYAGTLTEVRTGTPARRSIMQPADRSAVRRRQIARQRSRVRQDLVA